MYFLPILLCMNRREQRRTEIALTARFILKEHEKSSSQSKMKHCKPKSQWSQKNCIQRVVEWKKIISSQRWFLEHCNRHEVKVVYLSYLSIVSAKMSVYSKSVIMRLRYSRDLRPCWRHSKKSVCLSKGASSCLVNSYIKYGELLKAKNAREILLDEY